MGPLWSYTHLRERFLHVKNSGSGFHYFFFPTTNAILEIPRKTKGYFHTTPTYITYTDWPMQYHTQKKELHTTWQFRLLFPSSPPSSSSPSSSPQRPPTPEITNWTGFLPSPRAMGRSRNARPAMNSQWTPRSTGECSPPATT